MSIQSCMVCNKEASLRTKGWHRVIISTKNGEWQTFFSVCPDCQPVRKGKQTTKTELTGEEFYQLLTQ